MQTAKRSITLSIDGMTCVNCQNKIEKALEEKKGILDASVSYSKGTADIVYDENLISLDQVEAIRRLLLDTVVFFFCEKIGESLMNVK